MRMLPGSCQAPLTMALYRTMGRAVASGAGANTPARCNGGSLPSMNLFLMKTRASVRIVPLASSLVQFFCNAASRSEGEKHPFGSPLIARCHVAIHGHMA